MSYDVVVVGAGLGGLTAGALLAARGASVCVIERTSEAGGCASHVEHHGYRFEPGASLYASWGAGEIHERVFAELGVAPPEVRRLDIPYVVRLPDGTDISLGGSVEEFETTLGQTFPECADAAISFYRSIAPVSDSLSRILRRVPDAATASTLRRTTALAAAGSSAPHILTTLHHTAAQHLPQNSSERFRRFIDAQLQIFAQRTSDECAYLYAALALQIPRRGTYAIRGGASALASVLTEAVRQRGGTVRFDTTALRLAFDERGRAAGVTLLSGETVAARRAVVSNLTVWDTYGKLAGLNRTPPEVRARLKNLRGWGAYLLYLGMDEEAVARLPAERVLALHDTQRGARFDPEQDLFMFSVAPAWDTRAPAGKRAVTVSTFTEPEQWFAFHEDETEHEARDQTMLEACWQRIHAALPELGANVEVIETATPRTFYEQTRRKLGMVCGIGQSPDLFLSNSITHRTTIPNLFMVGDTTFPGHGIAAVTHSALVVANEITGSKR